MAEAAGIEPDHLQLTNWLMAHDFRRKTTIPRRFSSPIESPGGFIRGLGRCLERPYIRADGYGIGHLSLCTLAAW